MAKAQESQPYDRGNKWLIEHAGPSLLRYAGMADVVSCRAVANEHVQPRQTPDGLLEVRRIGRSTSGNRSRG